MRLRTSLSPTGCLATRFSGAIRWLGDSYVEPRIEGWSDAKMNVTLKAFFQLACDQDFGDNVVLLDVETANRRPFGAPAGLALNDATAEGHGTLDLATDC